MTSKITEEGSCPCREAGHILSGNVRQAMRKASSPIGKAALTVDNAALAVAFVEVGRAVILLRSSLYSG